MAASRDPGRRRLRRLPSDAEGFNVPPASLETCLGTLLAHPAARDTLLAATAAASAIPVVGPVIGAASGLVGGDLVDDMIGDHERKGLEELDADKRTDEIQEHLGPAAVAALCTNKAATRALLAHDPQATKALKLWIVDGALVPPDPSDPSWSDFHEALRKLAYKDQSLVGAVFDDLGIRAKAAG
ncbi:MAG: hypothetical protein ACRDY5_10825 [Acidimicrobiales bacterium]